MKKPNWIAAAVWMALSAAPIAALYWGWIVEPWKIAVAVWEVL